MSGLVYVAQEGKLEKLKRMLSGRLRTNDAAAPPRSPAVHEVDEHGACAIHQAAREGHTHVVKYLVGRGADVNAQGELGRTPLMYAAECRRTSDPLTALLGAGARLHDADDGLGASALGLAAQMGSREAVELLLWAGADVLQADRHGMLPVHRAAQHGELETLVALLDNTLAPPVDATSVVIEDNGVGSQGQLHLTNSQAQLISSQANLGNNSMVDAVSTLNHATPLHCAASGGRAHNVLLLMQRGASINAQMTDGSTALHVASGSGGRKVAEALLDHGANVDARKDGGFSALVTACAAGDLDMSTLLLENGADANLAGENGWGPLHFAAQKGDLELTRLLLPQCEPNATTTQGENALLIAIKHNHLHVARMLLDHSDAQQTDSDGNTTLHHAAGTGNVALVRLLLGRGRGNSLYVVRNSSGHTPLMVAAIRGHGTNVKVLLQREAALLHEFVEQYQRQTFNQSKNRETAQHMDKETAQQKDQNTDQHMDDQTNGHGEWGLMEGLASAPHAVVLKFVLDHDEHTSKL